jgi:hypothetical protein
MKKLIALTFVVFIRAANFWEGFYLFLSFEARDSYSKQALLPLYASSPRLMSFHLSLKQ